MKDPAGVSLDTGEPRFRKHILGSQFSNTMVMPSTFRVE